MAKPPHRSRTAPSPAQAAVQAGVQLMQAGRLREAEQALRQALSLNPDEPDALHFMGLLAAQAGRLDLAEDFIRRAVARQPRYVDAHNNLGNVLMSRGRHADAETAYRKAVELEPRYAQAHYNLGNCRRAMGDLDSAIAAYRRALTIQPDHLDALNNLASALTQNDEFDSAIETLSRANALRPRQAGILLNLANAHRKKGDLALARQRYREALEVQPDYPEALASLALLEMAEGRLDEALALCRKALERAPALIEARAALAAIHRARKEKQAALDACFAALELNPRKAEIYHGIGEILGEEKCYAEAIAAYEDALTLRPDLQSAVLRRARLRQEICDWREWVADLERMRAAIANPHEASVATFSLLSLPGFGERDFHHYLTALSRFDFFRSRRLPEAPSRRGTDHRQRIGYMSSDLRKHPVGYVTVGLFEHHDRERFEVFAYSTGPDDGSRIRRRLEGAFDHFVDIRELSHEQAAQRIRNDAIDILVDLNGNTLDARAEILAMRPAPIQVNWLGYPGTMGADFMDYIVVDPFVVPPEQAPYYTEKLAYLPDTYFPNDRTRIAGIAPSRAEAGLPDSAVVFCCFNNAYKITPEVFDVWCRLLVDVPDSVLWLSVVADAQSNLRREAEARGVDPARLIFASRVPSMADHLARLSLADLFLDTLPYNAHTTASDALWAGVPVVTCAGETFPSRVAGSLLRAVGLPELVTERLDRYRDLALRLATQPDELKAIRQRLAENRLTTPLFDSERFTRNLEGLYRRMWERHEQGLPPDMLEPS